MLKNNVDFLLKSRLNAQFDIKRKVKQLDY